MAHVAPVYASFSKGEISPLINGRIDIEQYPTCLEKCRNMWIRPHGCASRIQGSEYVNSTKSNSKARLLKFVFSPTDSYIIECGAGYFRFYQNGGVITKDDADLWVTATNYKKGDYVKHNSVIYYCLFNHTSADFDDDFLNGYWLEQTIYEVPNDYYEDQLDSIQYVQLDDIIKLTCLPHEDDNSTAKPKELIRYLTGGGKIEWEFKNVDFKETPYLEQNITDITLQPSATTGNITITASSSYFKNEMVGANFWIGTTVTDSATNQKVQGYVKITGVTDGTHASATVKATLSGTGATKLWGEGAFSDYRGYPAVVGLYDGRLYYARTPHQPRNIYGSKPYAYEVFTPSVDNEDDGAINVELATNANGDGSDIRWLCGASFLMCGTYGGEFVIRGAGDGAITPTDISARQRTNWGGERIQPIVAGSFIHFIQRNGNKLRQFQYDYYYDAYKAVDVSIFSEHFLESPIKQMALQKNPDSIIYLLREDGNVVIVTLEQDQSLNAWSLLEDLGASVESIQTIPSFNGSYDEVYLLMKRQGYLSVLNVDSSNPNLTIINNYDKTENAEGVITKQFTCEKITNNIEITGDIQVSGTKISGFKNTNKAKIPVRFTPENKTWEIVTKVKTSTDVSSNQEILTSINNYIEVAVWSSKFFLEIGNSKVYGTYQVLPNTDYFVKVIYDGTKYILQYSQDGTNYIQDIVINVSTPRPSSDLYFGFDYDTGGEYWQGSIDLNGSYVDIAGSRLWQGTSAKWSSSDDKKLSDYQISVVGFPMLSDTLDLTITTISTGNVRFIERMKGPITPEIQQDCWYVRSGLEYDAYKETIGNDLTLSGISGEITITSDEDCFNLSSVGKRIRVIDNNSNVIGQGYITGYTSEREVSLHVVKDFQSLIIQGGTWGLSVSEISGLEHLEGKEVQILADGAVQTNKIVSNGSIMLELDAWKVITGLGYQSYMATLPLEAGSQNGTAMGKRKRIGELSLRVWRTLGCRVGMSLNNLVEVKLRTPQSPMGLPEKIYTGIIPNIKYNQGWVWDANIIVEQSKPLPMNILSIAPIVSEVDK